MRSTTASPHRSPSPSTCSCPRRSCRLHARLHRPAHDVDGGSGRHHRTRHGVEGDRFGPHRRRRRRRRLRRLGEPHDRGLHRQRRQPPASGRRADVEGLVTQVRAGLDKGRSVAVCWRLGVFSCARPSVTTGLPAVRRRRRAPGRRRSPPARRCTRAVTRAFVGHDVIIAAGTAELDADSDAQTKPTIKYAGIGGFVNVASPRQGITDHDTEAWIGDRGSISSGRPQITADDNLRAIPTLESFGLAGLLTSGSSGALVPRRPLPASATARASRPPASRCGRRGSTRPRRVETTGLGGLAAVTIIDTSAKDESNVTARIGPSGPRRRRRPDHGHDHRQGGIIVEALLDSGVVANSDLTSLSFGASGRDDRGQPAGDREGRRRPGSTARRRLGRHRDRRRPRRRHLRRRLRASASPPASPWRRQRDREPQRHREGAVGANAIAVRHRRRHDQHQRRPQRRLRPRRPASASLEGAGATANNTRWRLGAFGDTVTKAHAKIVVDTTVEAGATFNTPGGAIIVTAGGRNIAPATLKSISAAIVRISSGKASPVAEGTTTVTFAGNVGSAGTAGAASLLVQASGFTYAFGTMNASGGGLVSVGTGDATRRQPVAHGELRRRLERDQRLRHDHVIATQATDADATAKSVHGRPRRGQQLQPSTATPSVTIDVNDSHRSSPADPDDQGGQWRRAHPGLRRHLLSVEGDDGSTGNTITLTVTASRCRSSTGSATAPRSPTRAAAAGSQRPHLQRHPARRHDPARRPFRRRQVDPTTDIITFGTRASRSPTHARLQHLRRLRRWPDGAASSSTTKRVRRGDHALTNANRYRVTVVDQFRIRLLPSASRGASSVNGSSGVDPTTTRSSPPTSLQNDEFVVYYAPVDHSFKGTARRGADQRRRRPGATPRRSAAGSRTATTRSTSARSGERRRRLIGHGYDTGDAVVYDVEIGGFPFPSLSAATTISSSGSTTTASSSPTRAARLLASTMPPVCVISCHGSRPRDHEYQARVVIDLAPQSPPTSTTRSCREPRPDRRPPQRRRLLRDQSKPGGLPALRDSLAAAPSTSPERVATTIASAGRASTSRGPAHARPRRPTARSSSST